MGLFGKAKRQIVMVAGTDYPCRFPSGKYTHRAYDTCKAAKVNDKVTLKKYDYKGETAYAVMLDKVGSDIGVIPKNRIAALEKWESLDGMTGYIDDIEKERAEDNEGAMDKLYHYEIEITLERS